jgi:hypothetical protein
MKGERFGQSLFVMETLNGTITTIVDTRYRLLTLPREQSICG